MHSMVSLPLHPMTSCGCASRRAVSDRLPSGPRSHHHVAAGWAGLIRPSSCSRSREGNGNSGDGAYLIGERRVHAAVCRVTGRSPEPPGHNALWSRAHTGFQAPQTNLSDSPGEEQPGEESDTVIRHGGGHDTMATGGTAGYTRNSGERTRMSSRPCPWLLVGLSGGL